MQRRWDGVKPRLLTGKKEGGREATGRYGNEAAIFVTTMTTIHSVFLSYDSMYIFTVGMGGVNKKVSLT